jgi:hypothetical protein
VDTHDRFLEGLTTLGRFLLAFLPRRYNENRAHNPTSCRCDTGIRSGACRHLDFRLFKFRLARDFDNVNTDSSYNSRVECAVD